MKSNLARWALGASVVASLALGGTAAMAAQGALFPTGEASGPIQKPAPNYPRNAAGLTFGSATDADKPSNEPDLISAVGDDGTKGYVYAKDLKGHPDFKSPEEAMAWQSANAGKKRSVGLFDSSGTKQIGSFSIAAPSQANVDLFQKSLK